MPLCSFCGNPIRRGTGLLYVKRDGAAFWFCSRKCERNLLVLQRNPLATKWTAAFAGARESIKPEKQKEIKAAAVEREMEKALKREAEKEIQPKERRKARRKRAQLKRKKRKAKGK